MKQESEKVLATALSKVAGRAVSASANSRCMFIYHQPKQPDTVKRFRRF